MPDTVPEALLVCAPLLEADRVLLDDAVAHDEVGEVVLDGVDVATGCTEADLVEDGDDEEAGDTEGEPETVPQPDTRGESEGAALLETERLAPPEAVAEGERDCVPLAEGEAAGAACVKLTEINIEMSGLHSPRPRLRPPPLGVSVDDGESCYVPEARTSPGSTLYLPDDIASTSNFAAPVLPTAPEEDAASLVSAAPTANTMAFSEAPTSHTFAMSV